MLKHKITIYIPGTIDIDKIADASLIETEKNKVVSFLVNSFGGCTLSNAAGYYKAANGSIVYDDIILAYANVEKITDDIKEAVIDIAHMLCLEMQQECISVEFDSVLQFVC